MDWTTPGNIEKWESEMGADTPRPDYMMEYGVTDFKPPGFETNKCFAGPQLYYDFFRRKLAAELRRMDVRDVLPTLSNYIETWDDPVEYTEAFRDWDRDGLEQWHRTWPNTWKRLWEEQLPPIEFRRSVINDVLVCLCNNDFGCTKDNFAFGSVRACQEVVSGQPDQPSSEDYTAVRMFLEFPLADKYFSATTRLEQHSMEHRADFRQPELGQRRSLRLLFLHQRSDGRRRVL